MTFYCEGGTFLGTGFYAVNLNHAEETCLIKKSTNDFDYRKREFEVQYSANNYSKKVVLPNGRIYSLCTARGRWSRSFQSGLELAN